MTAKLGQGGSWAAEGGCAACGPWQSRRAEGPATPLRPCPPQPAEPAPFPIAPPPPPGPLASLTSPCARLPGGRPAGGTRTPPPLRLHTTHAPPSPAHVGVRQVGTQQGGHVHARLPRLQHGRGLGRGVAKELLGVEAHVGLDAVWGRSNGGGGGGGGGVGGSRERARTARACCARARAAAAGGPFRRDARRPSPPGSPRMPPAPQRAGLGRAHSRQGALRSRCPGCTHTRRSGASAAAGRAAAPRRRPRPGRRPRPSPAGPRRRGPWHRASLRPGRGRGARGARSSKGRRVARGRGSCGARI
jgi:hypothetical protein